MHSIRHSNDLPGIVAKGKDISIYHDFCITICGRNNDKPACSRFRTYYGSGNIELFYLTLAIILEYQMMLKQLHYLSQLS